MEKDKKLFNLLKEGEEKAILRIYEFYREEFLVWGKKHYNLNHAESADIFQDTVVGMYFNIRQGKINELSSSLKTYLFAIGKNLILKKLRKDKRIVKVDNPGNLPELKIEDPFEGSERERFIAKMINSLGEPCQSILRYFYFDNFSMDVIARIMGYKNQHVAKTIKMRCMKSLKKKILNKTVEI